MCTPAKRTEPTRGQGAVHARVCGRAPTISGRAGSGLGRIGPGSMGIARADGAGDLVGVGDGANDPPRTVATGTHGHVDEAHAMQNGERSGGEE